MKKLLRKVAYVVTDIEKQVFFLTGYKGWLLKIRWQAESDDIQYELDKQREKEEMDALIEAFIDNYEMNH